MAVTEEPQMIPSESKFIDKNWLLQKLAEYNAQNPEQVTRESDGTPEKHTEQMAANMRARGIDPATLYYPQDDEY